MHLQGSTPRSCPRSVKVPHCDNCKYAQTSSILCLSNFLPATGLALSAIHLAMPMLPFYSDAKDLIFRVSSRRELETFGRHVLSDGFMSRLTIDGKF